jgi:hypothetical protein
MYSGIPIPPAAIEAFDSTVAKASNFVFGEISAPLQKTAAGKGIVTGLDTGSSKVATLRGKIENEAHDTVKALDRNDTQWLAEHDSKGYSNFQRMQEDTPSGRVAAPNPALQKVSDTYRKMLDLTGDEAERVQLPRADGGTFKKAKNGRFLREYTPDAMEALHSGAGPLYQAISDAVVRENPGMTPLAVKQAMEAIRSPDPIKHHAALEQLREIKNLPSYVQVKGKWVQVLETDPYRAIVGATRSMARRIYFYETFGNDEAVAKLRQRHIAAGGDARDFDNTLAVWHGRPFGRVSTMFGADPRGVAFRLARAADQLASAAQTSLSVIPNVPQTMVQVPRYVGASNYLRAVVRALMHPKTTTAEVAATGAMHRSVVDWVLREGTKMEDAASIASGMAARLTGAHWLAQFNNAVAGESFLNYAKQLELHGAKPGDMRVLSELRLTPKEIAEIRAGRMTPDISNKIVQNGVKLTQYVTEDPHRKSKFQHIPILSSIFSYNNYAIGSVKSTRRAIGDVRDSIASKDKAKMAAAGQRLALLTIGALGAGAAGLFGRRAVKGEPLIRDDEDALSFLGKALMEVQLLGPAQRVLQSSDYDTSSAEQAMVRMSPKLKMIADYVGALGGWGKFGNEDMSERLWRATKRNVPALNAATKQVNRLTGDSVPAMTKAEREASKRANALVPEKPLTKEQIEAGRLKGDVVRGLRSPDEAKVRDARKLLREAYQSGKVGKDDLRDIAFRKEHGELAYDVKRLPIGDALDVWAMASESEKTAIAKIVISKALEVMKDAKKDPKSSNAFKAMAARKAELEAIIEHVSKHRPSK